MSHLNTRPEPVLLSDIVALDALFKRIAERGRRIRTSNRATDKNEPYDPCLSAIQNLSPEDSESSKASSAPEYES
jgi:hypothetical protein